MKLLPCDKFEFIVNMQPSDVQRRLLDNVSPQKFLGTIFSPSGDKPFKGVIQETSFRVRRNIFYRNSGIPNIDGVMEATEGGTKIKITMKLSYITWAFLLVWFFAVAISSFIGDIRDYQTGLFLLVAAFSIIYFGFWFEAGLSRKAFIGLFNKEIVTGASIIAEENKQEKSQETGLILGIMLILIIAAFPIAYFISIIKYGFPFGRVQKGPQAIIGGLFGQYMGVLFFLSNYFPHKSFVFRGMVWLFENLLYPEGKKWLLFSAILIFGIGTGVLLTGLGVIHT
jgi:hypothetical protein